MNRSITLAMIIVFNAVPIFGVAFYNWQPFEAFWFFWVETLIIAVFNTIRIVFGQGQASNDIKDNSPLVYNINKGIKYLFIRIVIFLFYSIFIIVFIGFVANSNNDKGMVLGTILFQNKIFNAGLLISIGSQCYYLITNYFQNRAYITTTPDNYAAIFDGRQLVIHVAIVLGAVGNNLLLEHTSLGHWGAVFIISLLCICKAVLDLLETNATDTNRVG